MAVIESRSLADAKADYLAAREREELAEAVYAREERLHQQEISSEQEYLDARQALTETRLLSRAARQKLLAMGFSEEYLERLPSAPDDELTRLEISAPFAGTVIEKEITLGERVSDETPVFVIADLSSVWLDLYVHERDVAGVRRGQPVTLVPRAGTPEASGTIDYTHPIVEESTRTVLVRAVLDNSAEKLRPGTFVTAQVATEEMPSCVTIDREAVQFLEDEPHVFVYADGEFTPRPVALGKRNDRYVEAISGVKAGESLATKGSFRLKAEIEKRTVGDVGHGHAH
jgi:cobalt-zinc-cadmium efflux system membrane fusion protein